MYINCLFVLFYVIILYYCFILLCYITVSYYHVFCSTGFGQRLVNEVKKPQDCKIKVIEFSSFCISTSLCYTKAILTKLNIG